MNRLSLQRDTFANMNRWALLIVTSAIILVPFFWIASAAFKRRIDILLSNVWSPLVYTNFQEVLFSSASSYGQNFLNSLIVASASTAIILSICSMAAYVLHRMRWPSWVPTALFAWTVLFHMMPHTVMSAAWFPLFLKLGLINTYAGLICANVTMNAPMGLWIMSAFVRDIPRELDEAATIDGCTPPQVFFRIILPLLKPGLIAAGILTFIFSWNEFSVALVMTSRETQTVPVGIAKYAQEYEVLYGEMAAASVLSTIPALLLLMFGQRYIIRGLTAGALK